RRKKTATMASGADSRRPVMRYRGREAYGGDIPPSMNRGYVADDQTVYDSPTFAIRPKKRLEAAFFRSFWAKVSTTGPEGTGYLSAGHRMGEVLTNFSTTPASGA